MNNRFEGLVTLVTGAASGLGRASAERLAAEGAKVVAVDLSDAVHEVAASLPEAIGVVGDVSSENDVDASMRAAIDAFGQVDRFHLNAGIFGSFEFLPDIELADFERVMRVNVVGQFLGLRAAFRHYRDRRASGAIAVTASIASRRAGHDLLAYHTSKHAVTGLVKGAATYGGPIGVRVNAVAPGIVPTGLFRAAASQTGGGDDMVRRASTTPMRRAGDPAEIAGVVAFLLSDDAAYTTGEIVGADGGASIINPVRPAGGAGAWDTDAVDTAAYGADELRAARERRNG
ncbi:oxidoreductase [Pseudoclavibacter endophyticus]|uniref:SDR family oxidoreductase n=1 Tax=Pseudoclavibacter endophyticus TaxID=1778590 RepID=A0A6H9WS72_9MICO|nr:SDR family oxidoreductase [Pseudoclavibacter endophyticus]KAB1649170.1 SDR family oxidoreductase [Pseudoclavibacter endophyticus]GGA64873.1 oxidoreductase [Pseudoclavibacter endophyticus]